MIDFAHYVVAVVLSGLVAVNMIMSLLDATTQMKYICSSYSKDAFVIGAKTLDWFQFFTGLATLILVYEKVDANCTDADDKGKKANGNSPGDGEGTEAAALQTDAAAVPDASSTDTATKDESLTIDESAKIIAVAIVTFVILATNVGLNGTVCKENTCLSREAMDLYATGQNGAPFLDQVKGMTMTDTTNDGGWCSDISPHYFVAPANACQEELERACPAYTYSSAQPYLCNIFACSDIVPGNQARYNQSMISLALQLVICGYLFATQKPHTKPDNPQTGSAAVAQYPGGRSSNSTGDSDIPISGGLLHPRAAAVHRRTRLKPSPRLQF